MINTLQLNSEPGAAVIEPTGHRIFHIEWRLGKSTISGEFYPTRLHAGKKGMVNGGILAALLDEALSVLTQHGARNAVNSELKIHFHKYARIGEKLTIRGHLGISRHGDIPAVIQIKNSQGRLVATAAGKALKNEDPA